MNKINGISLDSLFDAIILLQKAGIDTSGVKTQLTELVGKTAKKEECQHNWVLDGHNAGDPICSRCYKRPEETK